MKTRLLFYLILLLGLNLNSQIINVSTGVDTSGNAIAIGGTDNNWQITSSPNPSGSPTLVSNYYAGYWEPTPVIATNASWVNSSGSICCSNLPGIYTFERSFTISPGTTSFKCNFKIAWDDALISLELVRPNSTTIPLTVVPGTPVYLLSSSITNTVASPMPGTWKIRAKINFVDVVAAFLVSGNIKIVKPTVVCLPAIQDAFIHEFRPNINYGSNTILQASRWTYDANGGSGFYTTKSLVQFDLSSIPAGAYITSAIMKLHVDTVTPVYNQHRDLGGGTGNGGIINQVGSSWGENTVTWATAPSLLASSVSIPSFGNGSTADINANVTSMAQNMILPSANNGFQISLADNSDYYHSLVFGSRENLDSSGIFQPQLCITYLTEDDIASEVATAQCGTTLSTIDQYINADGVAGFEAYRFEVVKMIAGVPSTIPSDTQYKDNLYFPQLRLTNLPHYDFDTSYQIRVAVKLAGVWHPYGLPCIVSTPLAFTQVQSSQCNTTISAMNAIIYADIVPYARPSVDLPYLFKVTDLTTSVSQTIPRALREFRMNLFSDTFSIYNRTYSVEVAVRKYDGSYMPFGPVCTITTPSFPITQIQSSQCGMTATSGTQLITAIPDTTPFLPSMYRFRFTNTTLGYSQTKDKLSNTVTLNEFPGLITGTTYDVDVSLKIGGVFGVFGPVCSITTPGIFKISNNFEKMISKNFNAIAYPNPFSNSFKIDVKSNLSDQIQIRVYDMLGKLIENQEVESSEVYNLEIGSNYQSGVYNIIVSQGDNLENLRVIKK